MITVALSLSACSGEENNAEKSEVSTVQTAEERRTEVAAMEAEFRGIVATPNSQKAKALTERILLRYRDYISMNPRDSISAEYLFKAADLSLGVGNPEGSITHIDRLITDFPNFRKAPEMMLFKGFVYEVHLNQHANAVKAYQAMISRYPNHRLTNDARAAIDNLSLSEEELLEKLKKAEEAQNPS
jgi:tetratricopeptide (TPR) repeat protein